MLGDVLGCNDIEGLEVTVGARLRDGSWLGLDVEGAVDGCKDSVGCEVIVGL